MTEVGDDQVGLQYRLAGSGMVERDHTAYAIQIHVYFTLLYFSYGSMPSLTSPMTHSHAPVDRCIQHQSNTRGNRLLENLTRKSRVD